MASSRSLIAGYSAYASTTELASAGVNVAPGATPTISVYTFVTASSAACAGFTIGLTAGGVTTTLAAGC